MSFSVAVFAPAKASETVVWQGDTAISWNQDVYVGVQFETALDLFAGLVKDDTIKVTVVAHIDEPQYVITYKAGDQWAWTDIDGLAPIDGIISYIVPNETMANEIATRGLVFRGQGYNITQIAIASEDQEPEQPIVLVEGDTTTLWENAEGVVLSWTEICEQDAALGAQLAAKDQIIVSVLAKNPATEWPKVILRDAAAAEVTNELLNDVSSFPYEVVFTLTAAQAAAVQNGFRISGDGVNVTKVAVYKYKAGDEPQPEEKEYEYRTVWTGDVAISWNQEVYVGTEFDTYTVQVDMLAGIQEGDSIKIYYAQAIDGAQFALTYKAGDDWAWTDLTVTEADGFFAYKVASDELAMDIADHGLVVRGQGYHLTGIVIGTPKNTTGIESIQMSEVSVQKVLRNGQLFLIRNGVEYTVNGQRIK
ncbi:MAG: hypothetical protein IJQ32_05240 [Paludibacteraceae bacterium]|nr:hypothetical protein [Paludibacteraceae bacterium]